MDELKLAESMIDDAKGCIKKGDAVQASEKIYKCVEECIKILAEKNKVAEYKKAEKEGRWLTYLLGSAALLWSAALLGSAASNLSVKLKEEKIADIWGRAYDLHVWGFHEHKYSIEIVARVLPHVEWILDYTKNST